WGTNGIVFSSNRGAGGVGIWTVPSEGGPPNQVTGSSAFDDAQPRWDMTSGKIVLIRTIAETSAMFDSTSDGHQQAPITAGTPRDTTPPTSTIQQLPAANTNGWNNVDVAVRVSATDNAGGSGVKQISYALSGAQSASAVVLGST